MNNWINKKNILETHRMSALMHKSTQTLSLTISWNKQTDKGHPQIHHQH